MKNTLKLLVIALSIFLISTSVGIPVVAQEGIEEETTTTSEDQTIQNAGTNAAVLGGPGFIMIHPTAFVPMSSTGTYSFNIAGGGLYNPGTTNVFYEAPVNLPHGAKITKVVVYYIDNSTASNMWVWLAVVGMDTSSITQMASLTTTGANVTNRVVEDTTITPDTIDNQSNAYWIEVSIPGNQGANLVIRGIRIDYSYPVNLPLINK